MERHTQNAQRNLCVCAYEATSSECQLSSMQLVDYQQAARLVARRVDYQRLVDDSHTHFASSRISIAFANELESGPLF